MTKRHNIIVLSVAVLISAGIWVRALTGNKNQPAHPENLSAKTFKGPLGWGYDILVNDTVYIHQEFVPAMSGKQGFSQERQAQQMAELIINKIKKGQSPRVTSFESEQIYSTHTLDHGGQGASQ